VFVAFVVVVVFSCVVHFALLFLLARPLSYCFVSSKLLPYGSMCIVLFVDRLDKTVAVRSVVGVLEQWVVPAPTVQISAQLDAYLIGGGAKGVSQSQQEQEQEQEENGKLRGARLSSYRAQRSQEQDAVEEVKLEQHILHYLVNLHGKPSTHSPAAAPAATAVAAAAASKAVNRSVDSNSSPRYDDDDDFDRQVNDELLAMEDMDHLQQQQQQQQQEAEAEAKLLGASSSALSLATAAAAAGGGGGGAGGGGGSGKNSNGRRGGGGGGARDMRMDSDTVAAVSGGYIDYDTFRALCYYLVDALE
jgi:uncharacterized membrane protein YgcG